MYSNNGMRYLLLLVLVVCLVGILMIPNAFAAVGNEKTITVQNAPGSSVPGCEKTDGCFIPYSTVSIRPGDIIRWTNPDTMSHFVASGTASDGPDGIFDSGMIPPGKTFSYQFTKSGAYNYFCHAHSWMEGLVIVKEGVYSPPPSPPSSVPPPSVPTSKTSSKLILDPLPTTFKAKGSDPYATITFSGELESADKKFAITGATITLKFTGFTLDKKNHYEITTEKEGKFRFQIQLPPGKDYRVQAVFDGGQASYNYYTPSKSQTEYFIVTSTTSPSQPPISKTSTTMLTLDVDSTSNRIVVFTGQLLTANKLSVPSAGIKLVFTPSIESWNNNSERLTDDEGKFNIRIAIAPGQNYRVQAVFDGYTKDKITNYASQSLTQTFTVGTSLSSQPSTSTSSGGFEWSWILIILGVVAAGAAGVFFKKGLKKTPIAPLAQQRRRRRSSSKASAQSSGASPAAYRTYTCPKCGGGDIAQKYDGSQICLACGWKS